MRIRPIVIVGLAIVLASATVPATALEGADGPTDPARANPANLWRTQIHQGTLAEDVLAIDGSTDGLQGLLDVAETALDGREPLAGDPLPANASQRFDGQRHHLERARATLTAATDAISPTIPELASPLADATDPRAHQVQRLTSLTSALETAHGPTDTARQILEIDRRPAPSQAQAGQLALAEAVHRLAGIHDVDLTREAIDVLGQLKPPIAQALAELVVSLLDARSTVLAHANPQASPEPGGLQDARASLATAALDLHRALDREQASPSQIDLCPALALDLAGQTSTYEQGCALVVDVDGDDTYLNNAGGAHLAHPASPCAEEPARSQPVALVLDRAGDDSYGDPASPSGCGVNGGAALGLGLLVDAAGNDTYSAADHGTNGGATAGGLGTLVDLDGQDRYLGGAQGTNGGALATEVSVATQGTLIDVGGDDTYEADGQATNGGARGSFGSVTTPRQLDAVFGFGDHELFVVPEGHAAGRLVDGAGDDVYQAGGVAVNGGGVDHGFGLLLDGDGSDRYEAASLGANGGAARGGAGLLADAAGDDSYRGGKHGVNGGGHGYVGFSVVRPGSWGLLVDRGGDDRYEAIGQGTNGGGHVLGSGHLLDAEGNDTYGAANRGANGGAAFGFGSLLDLDGSDAYAAGSRGVNGGSVGGVGTLVDRTGEDTYEGRHDGVNGGLGGSLTGWPGSGLLVDGAGDDGYTAGRVGTNGGADGNGVGMLLDGAGNETYAAGTAGANGGSNQGAGFVYDRAGDDEYRAGVYGYKSGRLGANGGAHGPAAAGLLVDRRGHDVYEAAHQGVNGGAMDEGVGLLHDEAGDDRYLALDSTDLTIPYGGQNGGGVILHTLGWALSAGLGGLVDRGGDDVYRDYMVGTVSDRTVVGKGAFGIQCDSDDESWIANPSSPCPSNEAIPELLASSVCMDPTGSTECWGLAVSGTGDARGGVAAASLTGDAYGGFVAVSGTGDAYGWPVDVSGCETGRQAGTGAACQAVEADEPS